MSWDPARLSNRLKHRHLALLADIARHGTLTRVAAATGISQPAVTKALAELEDIFGGPLFLRSGRGLAPTPLGNLALVRARHMQSDLDLWAREVQALHAGHSAHLNVGVVPYVSSALLTAAISRLHQRFGVTLTLHRATTDHLVPMLRRHELDCIISRATSTVALDDLMHKVLYRQRPRLIAHSRLAQRLARRQPDWAAVAAMDWVLPASNTPTRQLIVEHFIRAGLRPPSPVLEAYSTDVIEGMLTTNETLISVVPEDIARELCQRGKLGMPPWDFGWELPPINLIRRKREQALAAEERFSEILLDLCADAGVQAI
ncbi:MULTISPECIES: LysR family transcriptional regulator [Achromobacter]|uniref:HTH-type transcriptional regulator GbpR n=1 Tax=Achromobacter piechaudii TaxID=72556 RepID=A0ABN7F773_9BURK|nr:MULTISPECIES: LysR substrate-binding domain-containing protein [Achromobacter]MPS80649.1 LysR family transcriptional regulator [Achromobacter sp.]CAB3734903.1 HTH-type transcriptional regulator GbpR [Achromobacter piechaudii]CAB3915789.1 HTH-type transcriptional regulator GbpR [Achromobacter piechaudii]CAB3955479.1 HTH-type transcriptional regulator GbpR [Achromobacter piechaudii]